MENYSTIREMLEANEHKILSPFAAFSDESLGRDKPEDKCPIRTCYQRDRDRVLHCNSWLREKDKTQVITPSLVTNSDHYRTRMTHSLEVSQIGRTIAKALCLNEDLVEAAALAHDIGHTPFGHSGESALNNRYDFGFAHTTHSVRVVEQLEKHGLGLNLTKEVRDAMINHSGLSNEPKAFTLEGKILPFADKIAYLTSDMEDAIRFQIITKDDIPQSIIKHLGGTKTEIIGTLENAIIQESMNNNIIRMNDEVYNYMSEFRDWMFQNVYKSDAMNKERENVAEIINTLCDYYEVFPEKMMDISTPNDVKRSVCDYVASMTDTFALNTYKQVGDVY